MSLPRSNKSLTDGLKCLQWILVQKGAVSLQDLATALEFETTRAHRLLKALLQAGFLRQTTGRKYEAGPAVYSLAMRTLHDSHLLESALPPLEKLRFHNRHMVALGLLWNGTVSYLYHAKPSDPIERAIGGCGIYAATNSGIGLATLARMDNEEITELYRRQSIPNFPEGTSELLARLEEVRALGYAYTSVDSGISYTLAISFPSNAAMGVALAGRIHSDEIPELLPKLTATASEIEAALHPNGPLASLQSLKLRRERNTV